MNGNCDRRLSFVSKCAILIIALVALPLSLQGVQAADEQPNTTEGATLSIENGTLSVSGDTLTVTSTTSQPTPGIEQQPTATSSSQGAAQPVAGTISEEKLGISEKNPTAGSTSGASVTFTAAAPTSKVEQEIERQLQTPVKLDYTEVPLHDVLNDLGDSVNIDIHLDIPSLEQEGLSSDVPVSINLKNKVSLRSALNLILKPFRLKYVVEDEVLKITKEQNKSTATLTYSNLPVETPNTSRYQLPGATRGQQTDAKSSPTSEAPASVSVLQKIVDGKKRSYGRMQELGKKNVVSASEIEQAKNDYEISVARYEQAQRALKYNQLLVELAEVEYQQAAEANKATSGAVSDLELRKLKIKVDLAKAKLSELRD